MHIDIEKLIKEKAPIHFTDHALEKIDQAGLNEFYIGSIIYLSEKEKLTPDLRNYKKTKYTGNDDIFYRRYGNIVFTLKVEADTLVLITVTNQEINLPPIMPSPNKANHSY